MPKSLFSVQPLCDYYLTNNYGKAYQSLAKKEIAILRRNGRIPTHRLYLEFLNELSPNDIISLRTKIFRTLKEYGIEAVARIGLSWRRNKRNRLSDKFVYFHIITDLRWEAKTLQIHFHRACQEQGLVLCKDYWIDYSPVDDGMAHFDAFTGHGYKVLLFRKDLRIQRFYTIGKWYRKPKTVLWKEEIDCMLKGQSIDPNKSSSQSDVPF